MATSETLTEEQREYADDTLQWLEDNKDTGCGLLIDPEQGNWIHLRRLELGYTCTVDGDSRTYHKEA